MKKLFLSFAIFPIFFTLLCSGDMYVERRDSEFGPCASGYFRYKSNQEKTSREIKIFKQKLQVKVDNYIATHPELSEKTKKWMSHLIVVVGMDKEQVLMLLDEPYQVKQIAEYGADEVWIYKYKAVPYQSDEYLYFKKNTLIKIVAIEGGNVL